MNITFIAPPAAGKGTQSEIVEKEYNIPHISTGDLLRNCDDLEIQELLKKGCFVSDEVITDLLKKRLMNLDCDRGFVLDGYPRTLKQVSLYKQMLEELGKDLGVVIVLDLDKQTCSDRIIGRRVCLNCGEVFNVLIENAKPKVDGICDHCGHELIKRDDDNVDTFEKRYAIYEKETKPIIERFEEMGIVYHVDSSINQAHTFAQVKEILGGLYDKH